MQGILHPRTERNKKALSQKAKGWEETKEAVIIIITHSKVEILHFHSNEKDFENQTEKDFAALDLECEKHLCRNSYYDIKSLKDYHFRFCGHIQQTKKKLRNGLVSHACSDYAKNCIHITQRGLVVIHHFRLLPQFDHQLVDNITPF